MTVKSSIVQYNLYYMRQLLRQKSFLTAYIFLVVLIGLRLIPFLFPESRTWGFNHLIFLPDSYSVLFFVIAAFALIIPFLKSSEKWGEALTNWFSITFFENRLKYLYRMIFIAVMTALFIIFSAPTHFLGDGYDVLKNIANPEGVHIKWSEIGITKLLNAIVPLLGTHDENNSRLSFQIISIVSGVTAIYFYFLIAGIITNNRITKTLIFILSTFSGSLLLFFGYAEYYPLLWPLLAGHIYFSLRFLKAERGVIWLWIFLIIGIIMHLQMILFLPAAVYISLDTGRGLSFFRSYRKPILGLLIVLSVIFGSVIIYKYMIDLYIKDILLTLFIGKPIDPGYAIISFPHIIDILNEIILISPFLLLMIVLNRVNIKNISNSVISKYLFIVSLCCLLFLLIIDPKLGMPRDWDLFALTIFPISLFIIVNFSSQIGPVLKRLLISISLLSIISILPFLITNLSKAESTNYLKYIIDLDRAKSLSSFAVLHSYYKDIGDTCAVDSLNNIQKQMYADKYQCDLAMIAINNGDIKTAADFISEIKPNKFNPRYQRVLSKYYFQLNKYDKALDHIDNAIQLRRYAARYYADRALIFMAVNKYDKALADLKQGHSLNPFNLTIIEGLAYIYNETEDFDLSIYYSQKLLEKDSLVPVAYYWIARGYLKKGEKIKAQPYANRYFEFSLPDSIFVLYSKELQFLLDQSEEISH